MLLVQRTRSCSETRNSAAEGINARPLAKPERGAYIRTNDPRRHSRWSTSCLWMVLFMVAFGLMLLQDRISIRTIRLLSTTPSRDGQVAPSRSAGQSTDESSLTNDVFPNIQHIPVVVSQTASKAPMAKSADEGALVVLPDTGRERAMENHPNTRDTPNVVAVEKEPTKINKDKNDSIRDRHRSDLAYLPLLPWEKESTQTTRTCRPPNGTPLYCCMGSSSKNGHVYFGGKDCNKGPKAYNQAKQYALSHPIASPLDSKIECDWCRMVDVLLDKNWTMTFFGDSVIGQTFFGAECELRRRGYNVTSLPIDYRQVDPNHWKFYGQGLNEVHAFHVSKPGNDQNVVVLRYYLVYRPSPDFVELDEVIQSDTDILVFDHGLHFSSRPESNELNATMTRMMHKLLETPKTTPWKLIAWKETTAQHFDAVDGHYRFAQGSTSMQHCVATNQNFNVSHPGTFDLARTNIMQPILHSMHSDRITTLPFWTYTQPLHEMHAGKGDCTHYCTFPSLWRPVWRDLRNAVEQAVLREKDDDTMV